MWSEKFCFGFAADEKFAKKGYAVFITSRKVEKAEETARKITEKYGVFSKGYGLDIRNEQAVIDIFNDIDKCDCLVETVVLNSADRGYI